MPETSRQSTILRLQRTKRWRDHQLERATAENPEEQRILDQLRDDIERATNELKTLAKPSPASP